MKSLRRASNGKAKGWRGGARLPAVFAAAAALALSSCAGVQDAPKGSGPAAEPATTDRMGRSDQIDATLARFALRRELPTSWVGIGESDRLGADFSVGEDTMEISSGLATFHGRTLYDELSPDMADANVPQHKAAIAQWVVNCEENSMIVLSTSLFDEQGKLIRFERFDPKKSTFLPIQSGTVAQTQRDYVCRKLGAATAPEIKFSDKPGKSGKSGKSGKKRSKARKKS